MALRLRRCVPVYGHGRTIKATCFRFSSNTRGTRRGVTLVTLISGVGQECPLLFGCQKARAGTRMPAAHF